MIWTIGGTVLVISLAAWAYARMVRRQQYRTMRRQYRDRAASDWIRGRR